MVRVSYLQLVASWFRVDAELVAAAGEKGLRFWRGLGFEEVRWAERRIL